MCLAGHAYVLGVDAHQSHVEKCSLAKTALQLDNLEFRTGNVRDVLAELHSGFDVVLCSGLLYHLNAPDVFTVIERIHDVTTRLAIFDTHVSLRATSIVEYGGKTYHGQTYVEHRETVSREEMERARWASYGNRSSFWFTRPSLVNALAHAGFSSVYECFAPPHINFGRPGLEHADRCTFVCIKGRMVTLGTSPTANALVEDWPERTLEYSRPRRLPIPATIRSLLRKVKRLF